MNEQLTQLATQGFNTALQYLQATEVFVAEQAPLLVQEVLMFELAKAIVWLTIWLLLVVGFLIATIKVYKDVKEGEVIVIVSIQLILSTVGVVDQLFTLLKIVFAPRLYLIEQFRQLMN